MEAPAMKTLRLTTAQALVRYLSAQRIERDGVEAPFFGGCAGIFGHGNLAGIGQALQEWPLLPYFFVRNEQAGVHLATAYARMRNRLGALACTSSIGPGATNMVTGAALATINRIPVLLLPGDIFARRNVAPVLQQLEYDGAPETSVNDCFRPVSRFFDRIWRPDQLPWSLPELMRVLTDPAQTGAATLCLPQDVQAEAWEFPAGLFETHTWHVPRAHPDRAALERAVALLQGARRPLVVAGGGVIYSDAVDVLRRLADRTGIPVALTQAGKGALPDDHPFCLGAIGATGTSCANLAARDADVVLGIGTRWSDFTTASKTLFQAPEVRFINLNVTAFDAGKHAGLPLVGDARAVLDELYPALSPTSATYRAEIARLRAAWDRERARLVTPVEAPLPSQAEIIGALNASTGPRDVVINAAGSTPGDLHKLWRCQEPRTYHVEYGYSCMGYEIPAGIGVKLAAPDREVFVIVGDGSYLMMPGDLSTAVQEGLKITVILIDNHGFGSIGSLSASLGSGGFGTAFRRRAPDGTYTGAPLALDFVANAASLGARAVRASTVEAFRSALADARASLDTTVIVVETDPTRKVPSYDAWWDVVPATTSTMESVQKARISYEDSVLLERCYQGEVKE